MIGLQFSQWGITTRSVRPGDRDFLCALYRSTRLEELAVTGWPQEQIDAFLEQQFEAQTVHYTEHFSNEGFAVLQHDGEDIGRLYLEDRPDELRIIDIALLPAHRGQGIGTSVMNDVLELASSQGKCVRIHVEENNPAQTLYRRLGFTKIEEHGVYQLMEHASKTANA